MSRRVQTVGLFGVIAAFLLACGPGTEASHPAGEVPEETASVQAALTLPVLSPTETIALPRDVWWITSHGLSGDTAAFSNANVNVDVLLRTGGSFKPQARIVPRVPGYLLEMYCSRMALQGDTLVLGHSCLRWPSGGDVDRGGVLIYVRSGATWTQQQVILGFMSNLQFGRFVAIDGDTLAVGSGRAGTDVLMYQRSGTTWTRQAMLRLPSALGSVHTLSLKGDTLVVGYGLRSVAIYERGPAGWAYVSDLPLPEEPASTVLSRDLLAVGWQRSGASVVSRISVFERAGSSFRFLQELRDPRYENAGDPDQLGPLVALDGDSLIAASEGGADHYNALFQRVGGSFTPRYRLLGAFEPKLSGLRMVARPLVGDRSQPTVLSLP